MKESEVLINFYKVEDSIKLFDHEETEKSSSSLMHKINELDESSVESFRKLNSKYSLKNKFLREQSRLTLGVFSSWHLMNELP